MSSQWIVVTKDHPCPICGGVRRCKLSDDRERCLCFRPRAAPPAWQMAKEHSGSATYRLIGLSSRAARTNHLPARSPAQAVSPPKADAETLHRAYSLLVAKIGHLTTLHRVSLCRRGLTDEQIAAAGYATMPTSGRDSIAAALREELGDEFVRVPGLGLVDRKPKLFGSSGILIPVRDVQGQIRAMLVRADEGDAKYTSLSSVKYGGPSPGSPPHVPLGVAPADRIRLVEGHLKADVVCALDSTIGTISCGGVSNFRAGISCARQLTAKTLVVAYDADAATNPDVAINLRNLVRELTAGGLGVELERWDIANGKGLDDLLHAGKRPELLVGEAAIQAVEKIVKTAARTDDTDSNVPSAPIAGESRDEVFDRVQAILANGNPAALFHRTNSELLNAVARLAIFDSTEYARIRAECRNAGVQMKEWELALKKRIQSFANEQRPESSRDTYGGFFIDPWSGCISRTRNTADGPITVQMCTFTAHIVDETTYDDGAEKRRVLGIEGQLSPALSTGRKLPRVEVAAEKFDDMKWALECWGSDAIVHPGEPRALPTAIRLLSQSGYEVSGRKKQNRTVYEHTGWRQFDSGWAYLHAGGVISEAGTLGEPCSVSLSSPLDNYRLPAPPVDEELTEAITASLSLLTIGPRRLMFPLLAATYRAPLGSCDFGVSLVGSTGIGKSELAALAQQHFGAMLDARHLPGSWSSTANSIERQMFLAKDTLTTVDDYAPAGSSQEVARYRQSAERVFRSQGNNAGRGRMRHDGTLRPANPPRGLVLSTGEDVAGGQSVRARQMILDVSPGSFSLPSLTPHQDHAADGLLAAAMAGFIRWIAPRHDAIQRRKKEIVQRYRDKARRDGHHARTPGIVAELFFGFSLFLKFAEQSQAITSEQANNLKEECWSSLLAAAGAQETHQAAVDHVQQYLRSLNSIFVSHCAHVDDADNGGPPDLNSRSAWGWQRKLVGNHEEWQPQGKRIGWVNDNFVYLDPSAAYVEVQAHAARQNTSLPVTQAMLSRMLGERGVLVLTGKSEGRRTPTIRRTFSGANRQHVLCLRIESIMGAKELTNDATSATTDESFDPDRPSVFFCSEGQVPAKSVTNMTNVTSDQARNGRGHTAGHIAQPVVTTKNEQNILENMGESDSRSHWSQFCTPSPPTEKEEHRF